MKHGIKPEILLLLIILAVITISCVVIQFTNAEDAMPTAHICATSAEVLAGSETSVDITAEFPAEIHGLTMSIEFDAGSIEAISIIRGDVEIPEDALCVMDRTIPGRCAIGILCPSTGINGAGALARVRFKTSNGCAGNEAITVTVSECFSMPLGGEYISIACATEDGAVTVVPNTAVTALLVLRGALRIIDSPVWGDANNDGILTAEDALVIVRRAHGIL